MVDWINISQTAGTGNATITVTASSYSELVDRTTALTVMASNKSAVVSISQSAQSQSRIEIFPVSFGTGPASDSITVHVGSTSDWTAIPSDSWITVSPNSGTSGLMENMTVTVAVSNFTGTGSRNGSVVFSGNNASAVLSVMQSDSYAELPLTFLFSEGGTLNIYGDMNQYDIGGNVVETDLYLKYKKNNGSWQNADLKTTTACSISVSNGDTVSFICNATNQGKSLNFRSTAAHSIYGNLFSVGYYDEPQGWTDLNWTDGWYVNYSSFSGDTGLRDATNLALPLLRMGTGSNYASMFEGCTNLVSAPATLPATILNGYCYLNMFKDCTSLVNPPVLPATTLDSSGVTENYYQVRGEFCYYQMFSGCTSLVTAPALPATKLSEGCYSSMFEGCTSLTNMPSLQSTSLRPRCYELMFKGCTSLTGVTTLPATVLKENCYYGMFEGCTGIVSTPTMSATTLDSWCCSRMFSGCTTLVITTVPPATILKTGCYESMFAGCTGLTNMPSLPSTVLADSCYAHMFSGCTSLTGITELPASILKWACYEGMFAYCSSLEVTPDLKASQLVDLCYQQMFAYCTSLRRIYCTAWSISANLCTQAWVEGVPQTGTFYKLSGTPWSTDGSGIPQGWTAINV